MSVLPPPRSLTSRSEIVLRHTGPTSISVLIVLGEPEHLRGRAPPEPHTAQRSAEGRQGAVDTGPERSTADLCRPTARSNKRSLTSSCASQEGWPGAGSNRRPSAFQADARTN